MRTDGLCERCGKLQGKLAKLPLVPLSPRLRKRRDKIATQLHSSARDELIDYTMKAYDFFADIRAGKPLTERVKVAMKKSNLVLDFDDFKFLTFDNRLPSYWTDDLSNLFEDISKVGRKAPGY